MRRPRVRLLPTKDRAQMIYSLGGFVEKSRRQKNLFATRPKACHPPSTWWSRTGGCRRALLKNDHIGRNRSFPV
jgi:hypothetical protein